MKPRRILVVDDNPKIHDDFRKLLEARIGTASLDEAEAALFGEPSRAAPPVAFRVECTLGGEQAVGLVAAALNGGDPFCVAFVDLRMPAGWDGVRTALELWALDPRLQIVFCTAYSDHSWEDLVGTLGVVDRFLVLKKPFDAIEVRQHATALGEKWLLEREREARAERLEAEVRARTAQLEIEMRERLRIEHELQHAQKLDALGRMAAGLAHEVNNPLTAVVANLELIGDELDQLVRGGGRGITGDAARSMITSLGGANEGTSRIARIMRDVSAFAQHHAEAIGPVEVRPCVETALRMVGHVLRHAALLGERIAPVPRVVAEPSGLEQVLVNLLTNALKALPPRRQAENRIELEVRREEPGWVVLEVRDNGVGIAPEHLPRVFDPFFTTRAVGEGMGLGLSVCRGLVQSFGGEITLDSRPGEGTTARVRLRAVPEEPRSASPGSSAVRGAAGQRVLLVDDEPTIVRLLARRLERFGVQCVSCTSGREALECYGQGTFDLVLCDLMMPDVNGVEIYRQLAALGPGHTDRLVFLSGGVFSDDVEAFLRVTPVRVLRKPYAIDQILGLFKTM